MSQFSDHLVKFTKHADLVGLGLIVAYVGLKFNADIGLCWGFDPWIYNVRI